MTNEDINKAIAEKVMGIKHLDHVCACEIMCHCGGKRFPSYAADISYAWHVVEKMVNEGNAPSLVNNDEGEWQLCFSGVQELSDRPENVMSFCDDDLWHESAPMAICLAALKAIS